jgi:ABC-2 type transport system permease protein
MSSAPTPLGVPTNGVPTNGVTTDGVTGDSVIHDIGFRHYDGPRLGRGWAFRSLLVETLRGAFGLGRPSKVKAMPMLLLGFATAFALIAAAIVIFTNSKDMVGPYSQFVGGMWLLVAMFVAGRAPYAVSRDLRDGVMPLYLSRPLRRGDYVLAKFAGVSLATFIFIAIPLTVFLIGSLLAKFPPGREISTWLGAVLMAAVVSVLLSAIALALASVTKRRGLGVAVIMTYLVMAAGFAGILGWVLSSKASEGVSAYASIPDPFALTDALSASWLGTTVSNQYYEPHGLVGGAILTVALLVEVGASVAILAGRFKKEGGV